MPLACLAWLAMSPGKAFPETGRKADVILVLDGNEPAFSERAAGAVNAHLYAISMETVEIVMAIEQEKVSQLASLALKLECLALVYVERTPDGVGVFIADGDGEKMLVRRIRAPSEEVALENAAVIISSSLEIMREGGSIGVVVEKKVDRAAEEKGPPSFAADLSIAYSVELFSSDVRVFHGPAIGLSFQPLRFLVLRAAFRALGQAGAKASGIEVTLSRYPFEVGAGLMLPERGRLSMAFGLQLTLEYLKRSAYSSRYDVLVSREKKFFLLALAPSFEVRVRVTSRWSFFASVEGQFYTSRLSHKAQVAGVKVTVIEPWWVRPAFFAGFALNLI